MLIWMILVLATVIQGEVPTGRMKMTRTMGRSVLSNRTLKTLGLVPLSKAFRF